MIFNICKRVESFLGSFTISWEQRKLSDIADKVTEKNTNLVVQETFTNSAEFGVISQRDFFDHDISNSESIGGYYVVRDEDFVYNPRISVNAPVGPVNRNKLGRNGVMSPLYTVFRTHNIDTTYLEWFFKSNYWHPFMFFNGDSGVRSDRFSIKDAVFFEMPIPTPSIEEQKRIGAYLDRLSNLITLHQRESYKYSLCHHDLSDVLECLLTIYWEQRKFEDAFAERREKTERENEDTVLPSVLHLHIYPNSHESAPFIGYVTLHWVAEPSNTSSVCTSWHAASSPDTAAAFLS